MFATLMFTAAIFTVGKSWKQFTHSTAEESTKKMWHTYTMDYFPAIKKKNVLSFTGKLLKDD